MNTVAQTRQTKHCLLRQTPSHNRVGGNASTRMAINVRIHDRFAHIDMSGHFGFLVHRDFKKSYMPLLGNAAINEIRIEMSKVDYLDISALGMLMLLNERAKAASKAVTLVTASIVVSQALEVANFSKVFNIKHIGSEECRLSGLLTMVANNPPLVS